jgi:hypothetical protein
MKEKKKQVFGQRSEYQDFNNYYTFFHEQDGKDGRFSRTSNLKGSSVLKFHIEHILRNDQPE